MAYQERKFNIPAIEGISEKTITEHLKLYAGYVKHTNLILDKIKEYSADPEKNGYAMNEMQRRFAFEFDGMRNHEYYFEQLEGGPVKGDMSKAVYKQIEKDFGSTDNWYKDFTRIALTRGIGWAVCLWDRNEKRILNAWIDEQHLGHLNGLDFIFGIDMWEHSYLFDYVPADKKKYFDAYMNAVNQSVHERRFDEAVARS